MGISAYESHGTEFVASSYIRNRRQLSGQQAVVSVPCWKTHYGLCVSRDQAIYTETLEAGKAFHFLFLTGPFADCKAGALCQILGTWEDGETKILTVFLSPKRGGSKRFVLGAECQHSEVGGEMHYTASGRTGGPAGLHFFNSFMLTRRFFGVEHPGGRLQSMQCSILDGIVLGQPNESLSKCIWRGRQVLRRQVFWPKLPADNTGAATPLTEFDRIMQEGFDALPGREKSQTKSHAGAEPSSKPGKKLPTKPAMDLDSFAEDDGADDSVGSDIEATRCLGMDDSAKNAIVKKVIEIKMRPRRKRGRAKAKNRGPAKKPAARVGDDASAAGAAASSSSGAPTVGAASSSTGAHHAEPMDEEPFDWAAFAPSSCDEEEEEPEKQKYKQKKAKGDRDRPGYAWGPFWLAPIKGGRSWGATCYKHHNPGDGENVCCKKQLSISRCNGDEAQCRKALKAWLVVGVLLTFKTANHRTEHLGVDPVNVAGNWEEADLDDLAAQLE